MNPKLSGCSALPHEQVLQTLYAIHQDLPEPLRNANQTLATLTLPLSIAAWTDEQAQSASPLAETPLPPRAPNLRRDFYTGEVFIERQSSFTLRPQDFGDCTGLRCIECENFVLDLGGLTITELPDKRQKFFLHLYGCTQFTIRNVTASGGRNLAIIEDCDRFIVSGLDCHGYEGYGLILLHSHSFRIQHCCFENNLASGLMILGDCHTGTVTDCVFHRSRGYYNWDAGLHICHCSRRIAAAQVPELAHEPLPIRLKTMRPTRIRVQRCRSEGNRAQGVYLEGARQCWIADNVFSDNNKEGICLDWGTTLCVLQGNLIRGNGYRSQMTATEIGIDFVEDFPLLPDQSSTCKLPGVSFDNGVLNAIVNNRIEENFGGGIKLVRSAIGNMIQSNHFVNNARGANFFVEDLFDIYVLSLGNRGGEFDDDRALLLDFYGSSFNRIQNNQFSSDHTSAIHQGNEFNVLSANEFNTPGDEAVSAKSTASTTDSSNIDRHGDAAMAVAEPSKQFTEYTLYSFGSVTDKHHAVVRLSPTGVIEFSPHPNESYWRAERGKLVFFDKAFNVSSRFEPFLNPTGGRAVFLGRFRETGILHYLIPLISTDHVSPITEALPPLFINTMPHCSASLLHRFFSGLGWVSTGIHSGPGATRNSSSLEYVIGTNTTRMENPGFPLPKIASIIQRGQYFTGNVAWRDEHYSCCSRVFCVYGSRNLRDLLISSCSQETRLARNAKTSATVWQWIDNPRDRFLAFLDVFCDAILSIIEYAPWLQQDRAILVRIEDIVNGTLDSSIVARLRALGISDNALRSAREQAACSDPVETTLDSSIWEPYWSQGAEQYFESSGLRALNERLGYEC